MLTITRRMYKAQSLVLHITKEQEIELVKHSAEERSSSPTLSGRTILGGEKEEDGQAQSWTTASSLPPSSCLGLPEPVRITSGESLTPLCGRDLLLARGLLAHIFVQTSSFS